VTIRVGEDDRSSCGSGRGRSNNKGVQVVAVMQKKKHKKQTPCWTSRAQMSRQVQSPVQRRRQGWVGNLHALCMGRVLALRMELSQARGRLKHEFGSMCMQQTGRESFVHAIFRSYLSDWKVKYDSYSTCMRNVFRWNSYWSQLLLFP
jgi:hypothetical protein